MLLLALLACQPRVPYTPYDPDDTGAEAVSLRVLGFNLESGDANIDTLVGQIEGIRGEALWGFSEVQNAAWADAITEGAGSGEDGEFDRVVGTTGGADRLVIAWDDARLRLVDHWEIGSINVGGTARAPLVGRFVIRETGGELLFMVNHLWRSQGDSRHVQAELLNAWVREQDLPVIAVGDYNFDWHVDNGDADHDAGYDLMTEDGAWVWVRPDDLIPTQCSSGFGRVLDFVFAGGEAREWEAESTILFPDPQYCYDTELKSDHRPVSATFTLPD